MLSALHIQDFVLIERAALPLGAGLTALTGETGAGKSILLDALGLAAGGRVERGAVRAGAEEGAVTAVFEVGADHPIFATLEENALPADESQIILRRVVGRDGRSRAFVNDRPVSVALLRSIGESLIEIHGQHDGRGFLTATAHRGMLDDFAALTENCARVSRLFAAWREAAADLEERRAGRARALGDADYLRHVVAELEALAPKEDEEERLALRRAELMAAEKAAEDIAAAAALIGDDGFDNRIETARRRLLRAAAQFGGEGGAFGAVADRLESALSELREAQAGIEAAIARLGHDPGEQEKVEARLFALRAAARKHGVAASALPAALAKAAASLADLDAGEESFEGLERTVKAAQSAYFEAARALSAARAKGAKALDRAVAGELAPLKLGRAVFETRVVSDVARPTAEGVDQVEFMVATNPGAPAGPLKTIASGGELSRFVLAMKAALASKENRTVIIFDEVDAGVGGAVADAVGERLARLARDAQVLVVTHSPQVAARADAHWRVEKEQGRARTLVRVAPLSPEARIEEIARMLSGATTTDAARAAARQLLAGAAPAPAPSGRRKKSA